MSKNGTLEKRAKKLLKYRITGEGEVPDPFARDFLEQIRYLLIHRYILKKDGENKNYITTPEGEEWALRK